MTRDVLMFARHNRNCRMIQTDLDQTEALLTTKAKSKVTLTTFVGLDAGFDCNLYVEEASLS